MRGHYNGELIRFSGNQPLPSMVNSNETKLYKKASLKQKQKRPKIHNNTQTENPSVDFNMLNYPEESINTYHNTKVMNLSEKMIFPQILVIMIHRVLTFPLEIFLQFCSI